MAERVVIPPTGKRILISGAGKQKIEDKIFKLESEEPNSTELEGLKEELVRVDAERLVAETQLSTITHEKIKGGFNYQFEAMREFGEKLAIIAGYGQHLLELVQEAPKTAGENLPEYKSYEASTA